MNLFEYAYPLGIINIVFGFLWNWVVVRPISLVFVSFSTEKAPFVLKIVGSYLLVSVTALLTLLVAEDNRSLISVFAFSFLGGFVLYLASANNLSEALQFSEMGLTERSQHVRRQTFLMLGDLALYVIVLFVPIIVWNPLTLWLFKVIVWVSDLPIIGWLVRLGGLLTVVALVLQGVYASINLMQSLIYRVRLR